MQIMINVKKDFVNELIETLRNKSYIDSISLIDEDEFSNEIEEAFKSFKLVLADKNQGVEARDIFNEI